MKRSIFAVLLVCLLAIFLISKTASAEMATVRDWIGLFPAGTSGSCPNCDAKTGTVNGDSWVYTSSCTKTPGANPVLATATGCSLTFNPLPTSGTYEFRMYANDQEVPEAMISISATVAPTPTPRPSGAVNCPIQGINPRVQNGLITTPVISDKFGNTNATCVIGSPAPFAPFKIPGYSDLKSLYFTQSTKAQKITNTGNTLVAVTNGYIYNYTYLPGISTGAFSYNGTAVVFIDGNLSINGNITGTSSTGLVLIVGGNINIAPGVTQIDAVLISAGLIYTAYTAGSSCSHSSPVSTNQLIVNGSLVSLNSANNIEFCRALTAGNNNPAELINNQPKYLVILRNLYSDNWQKWSEIQ